MAYLTPLALPPSGRAFVIVIPDNEEWFSILLGALTELTIPGNFEQTTGGLDAEQVASVFLEAFYSLSFDDGIPDE